MSSPRPKKAHSLCSWVLDIRYFRGKAVTMRRFLFRENALWSSYTGYSLHFGKGTSLLVTAGEFLWLTNYLFWKEIQWDLLKHR